MTGKGFDALVKAILVVVLAIIGVMVVIALFSLVLPWYLAIPVAGGLMWFFLTRFNFNLQDKVNYVSAGLSFLATMLVSMQFTNPFLAFLFGLGGLIVGMVVTYQILKAVVKNSSCPAKWTEIERSR